MIAGDDLQLYFSKKKVPSTYTDIRRYSASPVQLHQGCRQLLDELGWNCIEDEHGYAVEQLPNRHGTGFNVITIFIHNIGAILVSCINTAMEFNPAGNREMVEMILDEVGKRVTPLQETSQVSGY